jgi:uncharacterized membrane protein YGL010W
MGQATLERLFTDYAAAHRHPLNRLTHKFGIPMITFSSIAMVDWVRFTPELSLAHAGIAIAGTWYLWMSPKLGAIMIALLALMLPLARITPWWAVTAIFVVGWAVQLAGHAVFEKNRPAFTQNLLQALIGPLFFLAVVTGDFPRAEQA